MTLRNPAEELRLGGGSDGWDNGPAGALWTLEFFGAPASGPVGGLSATLGAATLSADGTVSGAAGISGDLAATLGAVTSSGDGDVIVAGSLSQTLGAVTSGGDGDVIVAGSLSATLGDVTSSGDGDVIVAGSLSATLGAATLSADGITESAGPTAALDATLGDMFVSDGTADVFITAELQAALAGILSDSDAQAYGWVSNPVACPPAGWAPVAACDCD